MYVLHISIISAIWENFSTLILCQGLINWCDLWICGLFLLKMKWIIVIIRTKQPMCESCRVLTVTLEASHKLAQYRGIIVMSVIAKNETHSQNSARSTLDLHEESQDVNGLMYITRAKIVARITYVIERMKKVETS